MQVQWKSLNGIILGQRFQKPTYNNYPVNFNLHYVQWSNLGFVFLSKFDPINQLIPLSVIPLTGAHSVCKIPLHYQAQHFLI